MEDVLLLIFKHYNWLKWNFLIFVSALFYDFSILYILNIENRFDFHSIVNFENNI